MRLLTGVGIRAAAVPIDGVIYDRRVGVVNPTEPSVIGFHYEICCRHDGDVLVVIHRYKHVLWEAP